MPVRFRSALLCSLALSVTFTVAPNACAQRGEDVVEGLLRGFLQSKLDKDRRKALERQQAADRQRQPVRQPALNPNTQPRPRPVAGASPQLQQYRSTLDSFAIRSASLSDGLQRSSGRVRGVRTLMPGILKLKTTAALMRQSAGQTNDLSLLREEYCQLDCQWREMSFRLQQLRGLDAATLAHARQLDAYCKSNCALMELEPQFNRAQVFRLTVQATTHLGTLLEDVDFELFGLQGAGSLPGECRSLQAQCRRLSHMVADVSYNDLVTKYSSFVSDWRRFGSKLYQYENRLCDRSIRKIRACNHQLFQQLWLTASIDRAYLQYVSHQMEREVDALFENMTVKALVQLQPAQQQVVLNSARDLYANCHEYCECVKRNVSLNELMTQYSKIDNQWSQLDGYLGPIKSKSIVTRRRLILAHHAELRSMLQVPTRLDRAAAVQVAASLEEQAQHIQYDVRRYGRYYQSATFRAASYKNSDAFYANAKTLHAQLQNGASVEVLQASCGRLLTSWEAVSGNISAMPKYGVSASRFQYINESRQEVLPVIAQLATVLGIE
jgi:hypothetical protein